MRQVSVGRMSKPIITINGAEFADLVGFFEHFGHRALLGAAWGHNLDAFNDVLRGGFGTPEGGFVLIWQHHALSRQRLGHPETAYQLQRTLATCDSHNRASVQRDIAQALSKKGSTVYDWLLEIIREHGPGGYEAADGIELQLEQARSESVNSQAVDAQTLVASLLLHVDIAPTTAVVRPPQP